MHLRKQSVDGIYISSFRALPEKCENAMASVKAARYTVKACMSEAQKRINDFLSKEDTIKLFYNEIDKHKLKLKHLEAFMDELDSEKIDPKTSKVNHDYMLVDGALIREKSYIIWLYRCLMNHGEDVPKEYLELKF